MLPSSASRSFAVAQSYLRLPSSRRFLALTLLSIAVATLFIRLLHRSTAAQESPTPVLTPHRANALAGPPIPKLQGSWDLVWKNERGVLLRTRFRIRQEGAALTLSVNDPQLLQADPRGLISGSVEKTTISFRVTLRDGASINYVGSIDNGVIHGTNSRGLGWMAIKQ